MYKYNIEYKKESKQICLSQYMLGGVILVSMLSGYYIYYNSAEQKYKREIQKLEKELQKSLSTEKYDFNSNTCDINVSEETRKCVLDIFQYKYKDVDDIIELINYLTEAIKYHNDNISTSEGKINLMTQWREFENNYPSPIGNNKVNFENDINSLIRCYGCEHIQKEPSYYFKDGVWTCVNVGGKHRAVCNGEWAKQTGFKAVYNTRAACLADINKDNETGFVSQNPDLLCSAVN